MAFSCSICGIAVCQTALPDRIANGFRSNVQAWQNRANLRQE
jgi:hypothetical protein